jgi:hypothetical protein
VIDQTHLAGSFNTVLGDKWISPWTRTNITKDKVVCGPGMGQTGNCAFRFKGGPAEKSTISQTIASFGSWAMNTGDTFFVQYQINSDTLTSGKFIATLNIRYTDGTPATKVSQKLAGTGAWIPGSLLTSLTSPNFRDVTVSFKHKMTSGEMLLDTVTLFFQPEQDPFRSAPAAVLALPPAP